ncbi:MAG: DNA-3-methyladenine glycosylase, partial [Chthoniobacterales bacterium]
MQSIDETFFLLNWNRDAHSMTDAPQPAKLQKPVAPPRADEASVREALRRNATLLPPEFYSRDPRHVAPDLLGKLLLRREGKQLRAGRIVEVEAYLAADDPAAHAYRGRTERNAALFGPPWHAYVYFIYGFHYCLNFSCEGNGGGVLIRALEPVTGIELMYPARDLEPRDGRVRELRLLTSGPGRLAEAFSITRDRDNNKNVTSRRSDLQVTDVGWKPQKIATTVRIGITKAAERPLRYVI